MIMTRTLKLAVFLLLMISGVVGAVADQPRKLDEFGDVNCEDEYARLDSLAVQLRDDPKAKAVIIFYGGRRFRGRLPKQGEAAARAARLKPYLVDRRGIPAERVEVMDGGYKEEFRIQLWVIPIELRATPDTSIPEKEIKFQKGKATARQFKCEI